MADTMTASNKNADTEKELGCGGCLIGLLWVFITIFIIVIANQSTKINKLSSKVEGLEERIDSVENLSRKHSK